MHKKVMHLRPAAKARTNFVFNIGSKTIDIVDHYKYLGILLRANLYRLSQTWAEAGQS